MKNKITYRKLSVCGRDISYEWIRKKVKNINLRVRADGTITVSSPHTVSVKQMEGFLTEKANFLFHALDECQKRKAIAVPKLVEGGRIYLFGEEKRLRFFLGSEHTIEEKDGILWIPKEENEEKIREKLKKYGEKCLRSVLFELCTEAKKQFPSVKTLPEIRLRTMKATWGNCRAKSNIVTFNSRLVCYPLPCIEYIVMHEFSHFIEQNHSAAFYAVLSSKMPDWKERKIRLNTFPVKPYF